MDSIDSSPDFIPGTPDAASGYGNTDDTTTPPVGGGGGQGVRWMKPRRLHRRVSPNRLIINLLGETRRWSSRDFTHLTP
ncbi:hypothetical protein Pmani_011210 [Petrolisthes manimaculis]|uniref:Uncharacterized protein n=1 Tax=Petrolisthes manimaculis TaxID=1843537 RepID=A0AAE1UBB0_9EUCA|nr:hypothetical protein Pmani_011210 [Petrolisthes manimaculis]